MDSLRQFLSILKIILSANTSWYLWNFRSGLLKRLVESGHQVTVVCPLDEFSVDLERIGCKVETILIQNKGKNIFSDLWVFFQYFEVFWKYKPSVYFGFTVKPFVYGSIAAQLLRIRTIGTITGLGTTFIRPTWVTTMVKLLYRVSGKKMSRVFFQNHTDKNLFVDLNLIDRKKTEVVPGSGVDLDRFSFTKVIANRSPDAAVFLLIGRMLRDKGVYEFVQSALIVRNKYPAARFQLLGPTEVDNETAITFSKIQEWVDRDIVEYLGETRNVAPFIEYADCVVLPSYREGIPRTLLEGAAMGRPLLAARSTGCEDVVDDKKTGFLFKPKSPEDLAAKIMNFIALTRLERHDMGKAGRKKIEEEFDERLVIDKYLNAIEEDIIRII